MTSDDLQEGMRITIKVAHRLKAELGRYPSPAEIKWRTATSFQIRNPEQGGPVLTRRLAMELAQQMMDVVRTAAETTP